MTARQRGALALAVGAGFALISATVPAGDPDVFWHLALGRDALRGGPVRADPYSWTAAGAPVLLDQLIAQIAWYAAYALGEWRGVVVLRALAAGSAAALALFAALSERARPIIAVLATLPAFLLIGAGTTERPQLLALVLFAAAIVLLRPALRGELRGLAWCVPLLAIWANVHGSYVLGLALLASTALILRRAKGFALAGLAVLVSFATPMGLAAPVPAGVHFLAPPRFIQEWSVPDLLTPLGMVYACTLAAVLAVALLSRPSLAETALLVPALLISLTASRHGVYLAIAAAPFLAVHGPDAVSGVLRSAGLRQPAFTRSRTPAALVPLSITAAVVLTALSPFVAPPEPDLRAYPVGALARLEAGDGLLHDYDWGGFLIWYAPHTKVFVDGRLSPYLGRVLDDYTTVIQAHPGWRETIARLGIRRLLVRPTDAVAVRARELGWPELAAGERYVLFEVP